MTQPSDKAMEAAKQIAEECNIVETSRIKNVTSYKFNVSLARQIINAHTQAAVDEVLKRVLRLGKKVALKQLDDLEVRGGMAVVNAIRHQEKIRKAIDHA